MNYNMHCFISTPTVSIKKHIVTCTIHLLPDGQLTANLFLRSAPFTITITFLPLSWNMFSYCKKKAIFVQEKAEGQKTA